MESNFNFALDEGKLNFTWRAEPPESLAVRANLVIHPRARLIREVTATYFQPPVPISVSSQFATISYRTRIVLSDTLNVGEE